MYYHKQNNTGQTAPDFLDINAEPAWIQGFTGIGVVVGVVDDGKLYNLHVNVPHSHLHVIVYVQVLIIGIMI